MVALFNDDHVDRCQLGGHTMADAQGTVHIEITEVFLRFYVLLVQYLDRLLKVTGAESLSLDDLQRHLTETHDKLVALLSVNRVVKSNLEQEYDRVRAFGISFGPDTAGQRPDLDAVQAERELLNHKMVVLSDLLAALRAQSLDR